MPGYRHGQFQFKNSNVKKYNIDTVTWPNISHTSAKNTILIVAIREWGVSLSDNSCLTKTWLVLLVIILHEMIKAIAEEYVFI